jgi:hypothetical protein
MWTHLLPFVFAPRIVAYRAGCYYGLQLMGMRELHDAGTGFLESCSGGSY